METRRTRIVCISDTHNSTLKLPKGDVLIHAGDLTNQGTETELARAVAWLEKADFECKIVVAGNHDVTLDSAFYDQHGAGFHNQTPQSADRCRVLLERNPTITYLLHESAEVRLSSPDGPGTTFTVFGSPYSPQIGTWAFSYPPAPILDHTCSGSSAAALPDLATDLRTGDTAWDKAWDTIWTAIPTNTDIVVTHTPPLCLCDWSSTRGSNLGCPGLQKALRRVRPRLAVCGHVHEGRGCGRVRWDLSGSSDQGAYFTESEQWADPSPGASKKLSIVNLTGRDGAVPLDNNGRSGNETCVVNSAITATNYPHIGGKKFNKPIVVDIDLRV